MRGRLALTAALVVVAMAVGFTFASGSAVRAEGVCSLEQLGIKLSQPPKPVANYVGAARTGDLVFLAGAGPLKEDGTFIAGRLGQDVTIEQGY